MKIVVNNTCGQFRQSCAPLTFKQGAYLESDRVLLPDISPAHDVERGKAHSPGKLQQFTPICTKTKCRFTLCTTCVPTSGISQLISQRTDLKRQLGHNSSENTWQLRRNVFFPGLQEEDKTTLPYKDM